MQDLILLVADKNMHFALRGALLRPAALGIRPISYSFIEHAGRDSGVRTSGPDLLALKRQGFSHALLVMDFEGCGVNDVEAIALEKLLDEELRKTWGNMSKAIVIDPEVDVWMWGSDEALKLAIGPADFGIREWLRQCGFAFSATDKPERPKEALERLLKRLGKPRSSALYEKIAGKISLQRCTDPAYLRLRQALVQWFPPEL